MLNDEINHWIMCVHSSGVWVVLAGSDVGSTRTIKLTINSATPSCNKNGSILVLIITLLIHTSEWWNCWKTYVMIGLSCSSTLANKDIWICLGPPVSWAEGAFGCAMRAGVWYILLCAIIKHKYNYYQDGDNTRRIQWWWCYQCIRIYTMEC